MEIVALLTREVLCYAYAITPLYQKRPSLYTQLPQLVLTKVDWIFTKYIFKQEFCGHDLEGGFFDLWTL